MGGAGPRGRAVPAHHLRGALITECRPPRRLCGQCWAGQGLHESESECQGPSPHGLLPWF